MFLYTRVTCENLVKPKSHYLLLKRHLRVVVIYIRLFEDKNQFQRGFMGKGTWSWQRSKVKLHMNVQ